jgi:hypothetical protein
MPATACAVLRVARTPRRNRIRCGLLMMAAAHHARSASPAILRSALGSQSKGSFTKSLRRCARPCSPNILPSPDHSFPARIRHRERDSCSPVFSLRHSNLREASLLHSTAIKRPPPRFRGRVWRSAIFWRALVRTSRKSSPTTYGAAASMPLPSPQLRTPGPRALI